MQTLQDSIARLRAWHADHGATCPNQLFVADLHIVADAADKTENPTVTECTCQCHDGYRLLAYERPADLQRQVNLLLQCGWQLHGEIFVHDGEVCQALTRIPGTRYWLLPHQSKPVQP